MANMNAVAENGVAGHPYFDPERSTNDAIKGYEDSYLTGPGRRELSEDEAWREREWSSPLVPFSSGRAAMISSGLLHTWNTIRDAARSVPAASYEVLEQVEKALKGESSGGASSFSAPLSEAILQVRDDADTSDLPLREADKVDELLPEDTGYFEAITPVTETDAPATELPVQPPVREN